MKVRFSILIPAIFERLDRLGKLVAELEKQISAEHWSGVEIVSVVDNRIVTVGEKRQMTLDVSHGDYVAFVDDDDWVAPNYVSEIMKAIGQADPVDVITFDNKSWIEEHDPIIIRMNLRAPNEQVQFPGGAQRAAWHTCAWNARIAKAAKFPKINYGEDWGWAEQLNAMSVTEHHIPLPLHHYIYNQKSSRATSDADIARATQA
jgi:glycosyltransferase involved in cell wall biosynthesis